MAQHTYHVYAPDALDHVDGLNPWSSKTGLDPATDGLKLQLTDTSDGFLTGDYYGGEVGSDGGQERPCSKRQDRLATAPCFRSYHQR